MLSTLHLYFKSDFLLQIQFKKSPDFHFSV